MPSLHAVGAACARRPVPTLVFWLALLAAALGFGRSFGGTYSDNVNLAGTQATAGQDLLKAFDPAASGYGGQIALHLATRLTARRTAIERSLDAVRALPHVLSVSDPLAPHGAGLSKDGRTALATVQFDERPKLLGHRYIGELERAVAPARSAGVEVRYGGALDELFRPKANDALSELIGFGVAVVVLLVGFGSLLAAGLPLLAALLAVGTGIGLLGLAAATLTFGTASPTLALMIGIGVGIDYALFLTTRFRQRLVDGDEPAAAAGAAVATSGHAVLVAAGTVALALLGLYASGVTFIGQLGLAAVFGVVTAAAAAVTLVPALLTLVGRRIDRITVREPVAETGTENDGWHRYALLVERRAWWFLTAGVGVVAVLAIPLLSINLGHVDDGADPASYTDRHAYDLIAHGFGVGADGPLSIVVDIRGAHASGAAIATRVRDDLRATPDVASVTPLQPTPKPGLLIGKLLPASSPQSRSTRTLFHRLVDETLPKALRGTAAQGYVTGGTAQQIQLRDTVTASLPLVIAVVVAVAFLLLMMTFRSVWIPVKAALLNLLSIGASYGVLVAVFQWGWGRGLIGLQENVPIESYVPVIMFAIVFGLSMDYEVFLLSRVKEVWERTGDNTAAVAGGLAATGRVITCAALIMTSVFFSFALSTNVVVKMLAVGLSVSVLVDATIVRLVLVPATMKLLGSANWWLPAWLDRVLPALDGA